MGGRAGRLSPAEEIEVPGRVSRGAGALLEVGSWG